jgi:TRAP-type mannitol/chloroaromatic compound transport system permease large subunit
LHRSGAELLARGDQARCRSLRSRQYSILNQKTSAIMPLVHKLGVDPVWFGVLFLICMQLGLLLPPHGLLLMTMRGVVPPEVTFAHIFQAVVPYVVMSLALLALLLLLPETRNLAAESPDRMIWF